MSADPGIVDTRSTFDRLVAEHQQTVLRVCRSILRDDHLGADAAQETFLRLWRHVSEGRTPEKLGAWLRRVAVTTALDHIRSGRRRATHTAEAALRGAASGAARDAGPEEVMVARELRERYERALPTLSEGQRTIFLLRHAGGMPLGEIAQTLDVSVPTVKTQFARACVRLQAALRPFVPKPDDAS